MPGPAAKGLLFACATLFLFPHLVYAQVVINEILPNPLGSDKDNEWIEIYNPDSINLSGYQLEDRNGNRIILGGTTDTYPVVYPHGQAGFALTNSGDTTIRLYSSSDLSTPTDEFNYIGSTEDKSWGRIPDGGDISPNKLDPSPGQTNFTPPSPTPTPTPTSTPTSIPTSTPLPTPTPSQVASASLSATFPGSVTQGESFTVNATLNNASPNQAYYFKVRLGPNTSNLNQGQTLSGSNWLGDTVAYSEFSSYSTDTFGNLTISLTARVSPNLAITNPLSAEVRAKPVDNSTHLDSATSSINVSSVPTLTPTPKLSITVTPNPQKSVTPSPKTLVTPSIDPASTKSATTSDVLGAIATASAVNLPDTTTGTSVITPASPPLFSRFFLGKLVGVLGFIFLLGALIYLSYQEGWYKL